jgi:NAD(P)-dependent dehydrogenase (short-subunit alcohol dehydrogenase family)
LKCALITGGTSGVGAAAAVAFAKSGVESIVIIGRDRAKGHEVCEVVGESGAVASFIEADLSTREVAEEVFSHLASQALAPDILVNAAGITTRASVLDVEYDAFDELFSVNVRAPLFITQEFTRRLIATGTSGSIVNILSFAMYGGAPDIGIYAMTKSALATFTKNAAYVFQHNDIRVNGLNIGWTLTPGEDAVMRSAHGATGLWELEYSHSLPLRRLLRPEEIANTIVFLASDSSHPMTGSIVDFDQISHGVGEWPPPRRSEL